jgi:hypothetical protein
MHVRKSPPVRRGSEATNVECNVSLELLQVIFLPLHSAKMNANIQGYASNDNLSRLELSFEV